MHEFWKFLVMNWWLFFLFGGGVISWLGETFDVGVSALRRRQKQKRKHELALKRMELKIAQENRKHELALPAGTLPKPGPCPHRPQNVKPVYSGDEAVAWLCTACDTQLPKDWAIRKEDL